MIPPFIPDEGRANRVSARRHLRLLSESHRALLEAEWAAGERAADYINEPVSDAIKAKADAEWSKIP